MDNKSIDEFPYEPITNSTAIRLLRVCRGNGASIVGKLENFSLDAPPACGYTTLSYVWGKKAYHPSKITLNGHPFPILESLYPILEAICDNPEFVNQDSWWWIDSICINQRNDREAMSERSAQVSLMGRIYKQSKRTVAWLGKGTKDNEDAMEFLCFLARKRIRQAPKLEIQELEDPAKWKLLEALLLGPWWTRVWTLQEFIIAPELTFYCGSKSIDRYSFRAAIYYLWLCREVDNPLIAHEAFGPAWTRRRLIQWYEDGKALGKRMGLVALMAFVGDCQATDGRDRLYSLLELADDRKLAGQPDYESPVEKIYLELVKSFVELYGSLDIICFAQLFNPCTETLDRRQSLPSWVPDWRVHVQSFVVPLMASQSAHTHIGNFRPVRHPSIPDRSDTFYAAAGKCLPEITYSDDSRELTCKAILIDHIDGLGGTKGAHGGTTQSTSLINRPLKPGAEARSAQSVKLNSDQVSSLMDGIARSLVLDREDRYLSWPAPLKRFRQEFQDLCIAAASKPEKVHPWFREWLELNKALCLRGYSLGTLCEIPGILVPSTMTDLMDKSETSFVSRLHDTSGVNRMARVLVTTNDGHIGMAPPRALKGDLICVLLGCNIPVVLRKREDEQMEEFVEGRRAIVGASYEFIGECYLDGFMNGEALDCGKFKTEDFRLS